jgi:hypothetical protein
MWQLPLAVCTCMAVESMKIYAYTAVESMKICAFITVVSMKASICFERRERITSREALKTLFWREAVLCLGIHSARGHCESILTCIRLKF